MGTDDGKAIKCKEYKDLLHFGIKHKEPLRAEHLHALFLYTDWTELCTDFSSSFRAIFRGERLKAIKARNSKYFYFSKYLKELVMYFGVDKWSDKSSGPFFCGLSVVLNIPQFALRLKGPTSTSLFIEVAMRFGGAEGMILELNNKYRPAWWERHFDCDWLSAFPEECERLFMGGRNALEFESVRIIETKNNYAKFLHAFHAFDMMLSGQEVRGKVKAKDIRIVKKAMSHYLSAELNEYDAFVNDTFRHFAARKTQIVLDLSYLDRMKNKEFLSLVMNEVIEQRECAEDATNIFKTVLFELFGNVQEIVVEADNGYAFNFDVFAKRIICSPALPKSLESIVVIGEWVLGSVPKSAVDVCEERGWKVRKERNEIRFFRR